MLLITTRSTSAVPIATPKANCRRSRNDNRHTRNDDVHIGNSRRLREIAFCRIEDSRVGAGMFQRAFTSCPCEAVACCGAPTPQCATASSRRSAELTGVLSIRGPELRSVLEVKRTVRGLRRKIENGKPCNACKAIFHNSESYFLFTKGTAISCRNASVVISDGAN